MPEAHHMSSGFGLLILHWPHVAMCAVQKHKGRKVRVRLGRVRVEGVVLCERACPKDPSVLKTL